MTPERIFGYVSFIILVLTSLFLGNVQAMRVLGAVMVIVGCVAIFRGNIPVGWQGRDASFNISGFPAVSIGLLAVGLGAYSFFEPLVSACALGWEQALCR